MTECDLLSHHIPRTIAVNRKSISLKIAIHVHNINKGYIMRMRLLDPLARICIYDPTWSSNEMKELYIDAPFESEIMISRIGSIYISEYV